MTMAKDVDSMTEDEINTEIKELHELIASGKGTPNNARRLMNLRNGKASIEFSKRAAWWSQ